MPGTIPVPIGASPDAPDQALIASMADQSAAPTIPGGGLTAEQLAAASTVPRQAFPDNDVDAALAGAPVTSLAPPSPVVPGALPAAPATPVSEAQRNAEERRAIGDEAVANATEKAALEKDKADKAEAFRAESAARLAKLQGEQELHRQAAAAHVADLRGKAESEPYHKFWETRSTGQEILTAIGIILGGVSWNANHVNRGVEILNNAMSRDLQLQKDKHADLWHRVDEAQQGVRDLDASDLHDLAAFQAGEGAKWDAVSGRLNAMIAANRGKGDITSAKSAAADANEKATLAWQNAEHATALANHYRATEQAEKERADAAMYKAQRGKGARGAGGGGGGRADALGAFADAAGKIEPGKPIPVDVVKLGLKAGLKPNQIAAEAQRYREAGVKATEEAGKASKLEITHGDQPGKLEIRDKTGVRGYVGSPKDREKFNTRIINYDQAITSLEEMAKDLKSGVSGMDIGRGSRWDNAVLAIASTTTAGSTDANVRHEAGTLKNKLGLVDLDSVTEKLRDLHSRRQQFYDTLTPVPSDTPGISPLAKKGPARGKGSGGAAQGSWIAIPARLSDKPQAKGKTEMLVSDDGKFLGSFR